MLLSQTSGVLLEAKKRIQINIAVAPNKNLPPLKKMPKVLLPVVWVDEVGIKNSFLFELIDLIINQITLFLQSAALTEESALRIYEKLIKPQEIVGTASWGVFGLGCLLILVSIIIFVARSRKDNYKP